jgi:hypothetical protein
MTDTRQKCTRCKMNLTMDKFKQKRDNTYQKRCNECLEKFRKWAHENKCSHGRQRNKCKECGGASICEHQRRRSECKECGGASICEHQRRRSECKECGGGGICEHQRRRSQCKECGGSQICEHQRARSRCKECGGSQICEHQRERSKCKECGGGSICEHQRQRKQCKECTDPIHVTIMNMLYASKAKDKKHNRYDANNFIDRCFLDQLIEDEGKECCYCKIEVQYIEYGPNLGTIERINNDIGHTKSNVKIACLSCNSSRVGQR